MNKKCIYLLFLPIYIIGQSKVTFKINKLDNSNNYQIIIELPKRISTYDKIEITPDIIKKQVQNNPTKKNSLQKLDTYIRTNIIDSIVFDPNSYINLKIDLYSLTTFNKAYRELYNTIREFSKDLVRKPDILLSQFNKFKRLMGLEESPEVFEGDILPDLAPKAYFLKRAYQSHPKITTAVAVPTTTAAALIGAYALYKKQVPQGTQSTTTPSKP